MIDNVCVDSIKTVLASRHPQVSVSVLKKCDYRDLGAIEIRCGEWFESAIAESLEP
jgi:hypothetical protein